MFTHQGRADGVGDVPQADSGPRDVDRGGQGTLGGVDHGHVLVAARPVAHHEADGGVGRDAVQDHRQVQGQQVALDEVLVVRQPVQDGVVDGGADVVAEGAVPEGRCVVHVAGGRARVLDHLAGPAIDLEQVRPRNGPAPHGVQDGADQRTGDAGAAHLGRGEDLDHGWVPPRDLVRTGLRTSNDDGMIIPAIVSRYYSWNMVRLPHTTDEIERGQRLGAVLRAARGDRSLLTTALDAGISPETLRKIETGRVATPSFPTVAAVAQVLGLSLDELWDEIRAAGDDARGGEDLATA
jgi:DNA-binding XRE family transcriptional regulator